MPAKTRGRADGELIMIGSEGLKLLFNLITNVPTTRYFDTLVVERVTDGALGHLVPGSLWLLFYFSSRLGIILYLKTKGLDWMSSQFPSNLV